MGAILEELSFLKSEMHIEREVHLGKRTFYIGKLHGCDVVLVFCRVGKVAAASVATTLINFFEIDFLVFTGVAGAVHADLNVGDIVIGETLYQHDMDGRPLFPKFHIPLTEQNCFVPRTRDLECAEVSINEFLKEIEDHIDTEILARFSINSPKLIRGIIATGDQFISNPAHHAALVFNEQSAHAVEMEGAAVAQVCHEYEKPFLIIRIISDKADHSASVDFQQFVTAIASCFSKGMIQKLLPQLMNK